MCPRQAHVGKARLTRADKALIEGPEEDVMERMPDDAFVVVDWRGELDEIVEDFSRFLPPGYVSLGESPGGERVTVSTRYATASVPLTGEPPFGLDLAAAVAAVLPPDFEARAFRESLGGDTHCYFVRPTAWWQRLRADCPERYRRVFAEPSMLPGRFEIVGEAAGRRQIVYLVGATLVLSLVLGGLLLLADR